ncbi:hypothetical protein DPMN_028685 [Dreissena polymorpha]|uniref:Uncharacterized protein n=1 Tax=Dreissena polymorpha TaxID=45954 RepID=A0A9D4LVV4_DREPO|nr:hypothetical protein DPMN_028685 [Dreissena polymorpha]
MSKAVVFLFVIGLMISVVTGANLSGITSKSPWSHERTTASEAPGQPVFSDTMSRVLRKLGIMHGNHYILRDPKSIDINNIVIVIPDDLRDFGT